MSVDMLDDQILDENFSSAALSWGKDEIRKINLLKIEINDNIRLILKSRGVFIALVGLQLIRIFALWFTDSFESEMLLDIGLVIALYGGCAYWVTKKPVLAFSIGLGIYFLLNVLTSLMLGISLMSGILIKLIIIGYMVYGLVSSLRYEKNLQKLKDLRISQDEITSLENLKIVRKTPYPESMRS